MGKKKRKPWPNGRRWWTLKKTTRNASSRPVRNADDAVELSDNLKGRVLLRVWSPAGSGYVVVDNSKRRR